MFLNRVLVSTVDCQDTNMKICFFNNCFFDEFSEGDDFDSQGTCSLISNLMFPQN